jgi:16S rRNA (uracil1498-N3)-methyltransferase
MPVFYATRITGQEAILDKDESRHLVKVLRLKKNDPVDLVDGKGNLIRGSILHADPHEVRVKIDKRTENHLTRNFRLHVAIAPTKSMERFEWFLEKATEIGIEEITPVLCERSERTRIRQDRSERILLSAMKQSGRALIPVLNPVTPLPDLIRNSMAMCRYIAHCRAPREALPGERSGKGSTDIPSHPVHDSWLVLIGPEGDFTPAEVAMALSAGFSELRLGDAVYRTETAGIMVCHLVQYLRV